MKKLTLLFTVLFVAFVINAQNVAINNDASIGAPSAMLDVKSTTKGFLMPRLTSAQRGAIVSPTLGLLVFDTDTKTIWVYDGSSWKNLYTSGGGLTLPFSQTVNVAGPVFQLENNGTGSVLMIRNNSSGTGLHLYSYNGVGMDVSSINNMGIKATSWTSNAIHAYTDNPNNTIPTIRANNFGGGRGLYANSSVDDGVYGTTNGTSKAGVKGETSATGAYGVFGNHTALNGIGVYGKADQGIGVEAISQNGTGLLAYSGTGYALDANGKVKIAGGNTNPSAGAVLTSDAQGNATWQQPNANVMFRVSGLMDGFPLLPYNQTTKVQFKTQEYDLGNNFISINENGNFSEANVFHTPMNGIYHFDLAVGFEASLEDVDYRFILTTIHVIKNGVDDYVVEFFMNDPGVYGQLNGSTDLLLNTGDKVYISARQTNESLGNESMPLRSFNRYTFFSGHLVKKL